MNPFEALGASAAPPPRPERPARNAERLKKEMEDEGKLLAQRNRWFKAKIKAHEAHPWHGHHVSALRSSLRKLELDGAGGLVSYVRGQQWLLAGSNDLRADILSLIGDAIRRVREKNGLSSFDDPLPGEPDNAFLTIRELLR